MVMGFITALGLCARALAATTTAVSRTDVGAPLTALSLSGERSREGSISGFGAFQLHGIGCRFELASGEEVDFDWDQEGRPIFDVWRLRTYAHSVGQAATTEVELHDALANLCRDGVLGKTGSGSSAHYFVERY